MTDLFNSILNHFKDEPINTNLDITNLIRQTFTSYQTTDGTITIFKTLDYLKSKNYIITSVTNSWGSTVPINEEGQLYIKRNPRTTFDKLKATAYITSDGKDYLENKERNKLGFWSKYPFYEKLAIALISGVISLAVGLTISKQSNKSQNQIDKQQDSLLQNIADSVKTIQIRLDTLK